MREYVAGKIGSEYLVPLVAEPSDFTEEVFNSLPSSFVMKATHGSGFVKLVRNKAETSFAELDALAQRWLSTDFYSIYRERHYRPIERRIFFEALLLNEDGRVPADMKFHVFNKNSGDPKIFILVISDRFRRTAARRHLRCRLEPARHFDGQVCAQHDPDPRPRNLDALLWAARELASDFEFVRVDLYDSNDVIYFGELTFTPGAGMFALTPDRVDYEWGSLM